MSTSRRGSLAFAAILLLAGRADATILIDVAAVGSSVVFSFSGTLDMTGTTPTSASNTNAAVGPVGGSIMFGAGTGLHAFAGVPALPPFGAAGTTPGVGSGDTFQLYPSNVLGLPTRYGGEYIAGTLTVAGSFSSLGLIPGSYTSTLPSGDTIQLLVPVPEPGTAAFLGSSLLALAAHRRLGPAAG